MGQVVILSDKNVGQNVELFPETKEERSLVALQAVTISGYCKDYWKYNKKGTEQIKAEERKKLLG